MTDELRRLHNITEQEDIKLYELLDWVKEKFYRVTDELDSKCGNIKRDVDCNHREHGRILYKHSELLEKNDNKINGLIGQNDYFSTICDKVTQITDLNNLLVQCDEQDKGSMSLVAMGEE
jgi:hypothetical protein